MRAHWRTPLGRAALGASVGGPVGVVTALAAGWSLVALAATAALAGGLIGALSAEGADLREAALDAILPAGAWLVGAAVAWVLLATQLERLPLVIQANPMASALLAAVLGGTAAVILLLTRLGRHTD